MFLVISCQKRQYVVKTTYQLGWLYHNGPLYQFKIQKFTVPDRSKAIDPTWPLKLLVLTPTQY